MACDSAFMYTACEIKQFKQSESKSEGKPSYSHSIITLTAGLLRNILTAVNTNLLKWDRH